MQEIWKDVKDYEGLYQVSSEGRVRSLPRNVLCRGGKFRTVNGQIRKPQIKKDKYHISNLCNGKRSTVRSVHQMVALAFITNFIRGTEINHIDGNPGNNRLTNLEMSNPSHDQLHAIELGLSPSQGKSKYYHVSYISKNPRAKARWVVCIRYAGKSCYGWKTFMTELEAAIYADQLLDYIGDTQRLRNFP